jgi:hypothetical protein
MLMQRQPIGRCVAVSRARPASTRLASRLAASLVALLLSGCAGVPIVSYTYYEAAYDPPEYAGDLAVVVRGDPYRVPQAQLDAAVIAALGHGQYGVDTSFVAAPDGPAPLYRIVILFAPPPGLGVYALCTRPQPPSAGASVPVDGRVELIAAACRGDQVASSAAGSIGLGEGPNSPEFRWGLVQFALALLPPTNPGNGPDSQYPM